MIRAAMGQQLDVSGCIQTEEQYIDMVLRKSGSLFRLACRLGASGCKVDGETARLLDEMADALGVAAQIGNDVSDVLRFDLKNDLLQRKKTLPVLYMLSDPEDRFPASQLLRGRGVARSLLKP
ncbi:polyprenyl synthetase family protein [Paenibacillus sp. P26]|nr:polyprenyl synthetase family protein [Paenibacillus sp. P26]